MMVKDIAGDPIDPLWAAEFRGFFFGDGFLGIVRNGRSKQTGEINYTPRAQITLRDDDLAILVAISERLGGRVTREPGRINQRPIAVWRTRNYADVARICDLLDGGVLPSKKLEEVAVMRRFVKLRLPPSSRLVRGIPRANYSLMAAQRQALFDQMQKLHAYRPAGHQAELRLDEGQR